ncbi:RNA polymerase sigma factor [Actomonas aquatica]|uniref:Sigma-70 family RNA polymerase sigma factor n=1 Tax=Actomonas aquatica TaxID=2866162 RepID=A0ABZ1C6C4_9BACT|nr:sigma-70 family RNA polymerase sigma factor [Opitutus sp. WL0086]WRQ87066.1 sigma-70 family RNA polymerase sigma factor [Opitutus sp. WL0086]
MDSAPEQDELVDDQSLIAQAQDGNETAFGELMQRHYETSFRTVFAIVRNEHDARDLTQEVWVKVWQQLARYRGDAKFTTWLHPIATRRALDHLRKRRRWFDRFLPFSRDDEDTGETHTFTEPVDEEPTAPAQIESAERHAHFEAMLNSLPPKHRAVLALREVQGLSYDEIATAVGIRRGTVMSRLFHARRLLAQKLRESPCD